MGNKRLQDECFRLLMVFFMVFSMTTYNIAMVTGLTYHTFLETVQTMWPALIAAFLLQKFVAGPVAMKLLPNIVDMQSSKPLFISVCMGGLTVLTMAPMMSLFGTLLRTGLGNETFLLWLQAVTRNFVFALCVQIFYVGPLVRLIHGKIFGKNH
jgi:hypothetical protein